MSPHGCRADKAMSYAAIEAEAARVRQRAELWGHPLSPIEQLPLFPLVDMQRDLTFSIGARTHVGDFSIEDLGFGVEGSTGWSDGSPPRMIVRLQEEAYRGVQRGDGRSRFTVAHELGHVFLHTGLLIRMKRIPHLKGALARGGHPAYLDSEWQANAFAGSLLVPADGLDALRRVGKLRVAEVSRQFGVSHTTARRAIETLDRRRLPGGGGGTLF